MTKVAFRNMLQTRRSSKRNKSPVEREVGTNDDSDQPNNVIKQDATINMNEEEEQHPIRRRTLSFKLPSRRHSISCPSSEDAVSTKRRLSQIATISTSDVQSWLDSDNESMCSNLADRFLCD